MKKQSYDPKGLRQLKRYFDQCFSAFRESGLPKVRANFERTLSSLNPAERKRVTQTLRKICLDLSISTRVIQDSDIVRIVLAASYWSCMIQEYAMNLGSIRGFKENIWAEVEEISELPKDEVFKLSEYFESLKISD